MTRQAAQDASGEDRSKDRDPVGFWSEHPGIDYFLAALPVCAHLYLVLVQNKGDVLLWVESTQRLALYAAGAGVVATIGGLAAIAVALYQSLNDPRSNALQALYGDVLRRNWLSILFVTGLASVACLTALALDRGGDPLRARFVFEAAMALWGARFVRLLWLFNKLLHVRDKGQSEKPRPTAPPVDPRWTERQAVA